MSIPRKTKKQTFLPLPSMADIAFILLIFFILTSAVSMERTMPVDLPVSVESASADSAYFHVWVDRSGIIYMNAVEVDFDHLALTAQYRVAANPEVKGLIGADRGVTYRKVNNVIEVLKDSGVASVILLTEKSDD